MSIDHIDDFLTARPLNLQALAELDEELLWERIPSSLSRWGASVAESVRNALTDGASSKPEDLQALVVLELFELGVTGHQLGVVLQ